ncbi:hypothetical protein AMTR_s00016p00205550 [Amborella trichopoda]|uniref:CID domain-containing protein n=1 Tax=Amborella trichopoda TaxID=13333 RepID=W1PEX9_AMBTC|nr:hypothetical protein AMTR_s00016p00205550 [Amborella trichopoda]
MQMKLLENSRRKGAEFVGEFWKVLPDALNDVLENGDDFSRKAAQRLIDIWEERKVFGSRGQTLKEELVGRNLENNSKNGKGFNMKIKFAVGDTLEKIVSGYEGVYDGHVEEESVLTRCRNAISCVEKAEKDVGGHLPGSEFVEELQQQHGILRECIEQLAVAESSRAALVSSLREALQEQEFKLTEVRNQLQVAQSRFNHAGQLLGNGNNSPHLQEPPSGLIDKEQPGGPMVTKAPPQPGPSFPSENPNHIDEDHRKTAAAVAAKLAASTSSAQMLTYVLSSLASEGVITNPLAEAPSCSNDYPPDKRPKLDGGSGTTTTTTSSFIHPPPPPYIHPDALQNSAGPPLSSSSQVGPTMNPGPPPLPPPPLGAHQFVQVPGPMTGVSYSYGTGAPLGPPPLPGGYPLPISGLPPYPAPPPNTYQSFQGTEGGGFYVQPSQLPAVPPISRQ